MNKLEIEEHVYQFDADIFEGDMSEIAKIFDFKKYQKEIISKQYPYTIPKNYPIQSIVSLPDLTKYHRFEMRHEKEYSYGDTEGYSKFAVKGVRWETDEEFNKRVERNKKQSEIAKKAAKTREEAKKKKEITLYENLKAKYEKR